jgi:hypothetical protein
MCGREERDDDRLRSQDAIRAGLGQRRVRRRLLLFSRATRGITYLVENCLLAGDDR